MGLPCFVWIAFVACVAVVCDSSLLCRSHVRVDRIAYRWHIHNFSSHPLTATQPMESPSFSTGGEQTPATWRLKLYDDGQMVNVQLVRVFGKKQDTSIRRANFTLAAVDAKGEMKFAKNDIADFHAEQYMRGWNITNKTDLEPLLRDTNHRLTVACDLIVSGVDPGRSSPEVRPAVPTPSCEPKNPLSLDMEALFKSGRFSDVSVKAGNRTFRMHRSVLAARSRVLKEALQGGRSSLNLGGLSSAAAEALLLHTYSAMLHPPLDFETLLDLHAAAGHLAMPDLQRKTSWLLASSLEPSNAIRTLVSARENGDEALEAACIEYVRDVSPASLDDGWFETLNKKYPDLATILRTSTTNCVALPS